MSEIAPLLWIVAIVAIFWLLILRPAQRRQKQIAQVQSSLGPGETVVLTSGIFGTVTETDDTTVLLEIAPGVQVKVARGAVGSVIRPDDADDESADDESAGDEPGGDEPADEAADTRTNPDADNEER